VYSRPVWVQRKSGTSWVTLVEATTTSTGSYATSFKAPALGSYAVRALAPQLTVSGIAKPQYVSGTKTLSVVAQTASLTLPATLRQGESGLATTTFRPARAGREVEFQIFDVGAWRSVAWGKQSSIGTAALTVTPGAPGTYSSRAWTAAAAGAPAFASPTRILVVTPSVASASQTTVTSSARATSYDTALTLTASVAAVSGTPTGNVKFTDASNGSVLANEPLIGGVASLTTAALAPGTRKMVATYSGDNVFPPSVSASVIITVAPPQRTVATAFQNNSRHDGMDTGDTFNPATLHRAWSIDLNPIPGARTTSVSYPLIAGGRIFVAVAPTTGTEQTVGKKLYALNATTGTVEWSAPISSTYGDLGLTYDGGRVFVQSYDGQLTAYDAASGHASWTTALNYQWSFTAPPTAYDGVVYASGAGSGGTLYAVSEADGALMWSSAVTNGDQSSPTVDDSGVYVDYACHASFGFGLDGTRRWYDYFGCSGGGGATSVLNGGRLYLQAGIGGPGALIVSPANGSSTGTFGGQGCLRSTRTTCTWLVAVSSMPWTSRAHHRAGHSPATAPSRPPR
jgi:outer membrane protein assembly factor BamB